MNIIRVIGTFYHFNVEESFTNKQMILCLISGGDRDPFGAVSGRTSSIKTLPNQKCGAYPLW